MCESFNCLPAPGGLFDQDAYLLIGVRRVMGAMAKRRQREQEKASKK